MNDFGGTWVNEFDKAVSSRITHQSTEEIKLQSTQENGDR